MHIGERESLILRWIMQPQISLWTNWLRQHLLHWSIAIVLIRWLALVDFAAEELPSIIFINLLSLACLTIARNIGLQKIDFTVCCVSKVLLVKACGSIFESG